MLARRITYNTLVSAGARIFGLALSLITIGFITRYLGQSGFGYYTTVLAFLFFFTVTADLGLYHICVREISRQGADEEKITSNIFSLRFFAGFFIFALAPLVSLFFPYPAHVKTGILLASFGLWLASSYQVLMGVFQKYLRMDKVALVEILGRLIQLGLVILFIRLEFGFLSIIGALVVVYAFEFLLIFVLVQKHIPVRFGFDLALWRKLLKKSLPLGLAAIFTMFSFRLDAIMLSLMKPAAHAGIYNLAYRFLESMIFFPAMFIGLFAPLLAKYAFSDLKKFKKIIQKAMDVLLIFVAPLLVSTFFLSKNLVILVAGDSFIVSASILNILIVAVGIKFLEVLFAKVIISLDKQKWILGIHAAGAVFNLTANLIFIPKYSYYGAALTTVLTGLLELSLMLAVLHFGFRVLPSFARSFRYVSAGLVMALVMYFLAGWAWSLAVAVAILVYFMFLYLIGGFSTRDILSLVRKNV